MGQELTWTVRFWRKAALRGHVRSWGLNGSRISGPLMTHCRHWLHRWVRPKIYSLADLLGGLMSTINAATICIAAAKANGTT